ncbi:helix-turn-helix domain-containing protein [Musicola paradisiaca]|uniref:Transcriptional regulator, XRE family n=1 Tax=Musicola paradisiaca (strain Ech703) TaxID=579405 RepID=C6C3Z4_MUSP7|nr:XRE family transcriptional regulator [Musicola paradisiaca]ACS87321.1 transcriptional regulator, XRE family [Musicola paradisiaca Ech703]
MENRLSDIDLRLSERLSALRRERGWSLDELALNSDISRATLSRMERGETSPTAALLGRLCVVYGCTMSRLLAEVETPSPQKLEPGQQTVWVDPETGFVRRSVSPPVNGFNAEMILGQLPASARIEYNAPPIYGLEHHLYVLDGRLEVALEEQVYALSPGDSLRYRLHGTSAFHNPGAGDVRYLIAICKP